MLAAVRTDIGKVREINEDYSLISKTYPNGFMIGIVADGMGGHLAGEIASKSAAEIVYHQLQAILSVEEPLSKEDYSQALERAIREANLQVYNQSLTDESYRGMGTTIVAAMVGPEWLILGHIGDSRAYLLDENQIKQVTLDHTLVNELLINGQISKEEAEVHPQKNIITRALGTDEEVQIDINLLHWKKGNRLVICSDGLTNHITDEQLFEVVQNSISIEDAVDHLLLMANEAGGSDNISIILISNE